jgi:hypothetical protein
VHRRVAIVGHEALHGGIVCFVDAQFALLPVLERVLEMREGETGVSARGGRIEPHRGLEELAGHVVVRLAITVHVP